MRLIDADALYEEFEKTAWFNNSDRDEVAEPLVLDAPTIDAVPVVRCKDCKHWVKKNFQAGNDVKHLEYGGHCPYVMGARYESDFCSYGERKDGDV